MCDCVGSNPQLDRLRQSSDVRVSLDDEEMREVDPDEHREALGAGIPQHLGLYARLSLCLCNPADTYFIIPASSYHVLKLHEAYFDLL